MKAPRVLLLAALTLALTSTAAAAKPAPAAFRYWAGCEAPAYCQPADGPNLKSAVPIVSKSAKAVPKAAITSPLWGTSGERFNPAGRLMDWSFAGYKQGNEPIPTPPVTKSYKEFQKAGVSDTAALQAALDWAHKQLASQWIVIRIPAGTHVIDRQLWIKRPRLVLRGDGSAKTFLKIDKPLKDTPGVKRPKAPYGYYNQEAFIQFQGALFKDPALTTVTSKAERGDQWVTVASIAKLQVGTPYALILSDAKAGPLTKYLLNNRVPPLPLGKVGPGRAMLVRFVSKILQISGQRVQLERTLPFNIRAEYTPQLLPATGSVYESGIEGVTFSFKWDVYKGHHYEDGYNAIQFKEVIDCWARDITIVNPDSGIFIDRSVAVQINDFAVRQTKARDPKPKGKAIGDAHWGIHSGSAADILVDRFDIGDINMLHPVGADAMAMFGVFSNGKMVNGNLELHRGLAGKTLFTDISTGVGDHAFQSGGPEASGANTQAFTAFWNVRANGGAAMPPPGSNTAKQGDCSFGPDLTFVGVSLKGKICDTWYTEGPQAVQPTNLYYAMKQRRLGGSAMAPGLLRRAKRME